MKREQWKFKRYYFLTSFAVIFFITIGLGTYFAKAKYAEFQQYALNEKYVHIENKKAIMRYLVENFIRQTGIAIQKSQSHLDERLKSRVDTAYKIAESIYTRMHPDYREDEIKSGIKAAFSSMVYGRNYLFAVSMEGVVISSPLMSEIEGQNLMSQQDAEGSYTMQDAIAIVRKHGEGYQDVYWRNPGSGENGLKRKRVYLKLFRPFNWIIGYGEYVDEFEEEIKKDVMRQLEFVSYENEGYLFGATFDGISISHPAKGQNMYDVQDSNGKYVVRELIETARNGGGFVHYVMPPLKGARPENKLSYVAPIAPWGWYIGAGMYLTDIEAAYDAKLKVLYKSAKREAFIVFGVIAVLLAAGALAAHLFSGRLQRLVDSYNEEINSKNEELKELNMSLEEKVLEKTAELNQLNVSLEERVIYEVSKNREKDRIMFQQGRLAAMGEMIGNIAHQWRQPLSSISLMIQDIQEAHECGELDGDYLAASVDKCTKTINHMSETIDNFRNFFNPEKKQVRFSVKAEIEKCLDLLDAGLENNNISISADLDPEAYVHGVPGEYAQVIVNIINNAKDALLIRSVGNPEIKIGCLTAEGMVIVRICDNGGGVEDKIKEKIFEPYFTTKSHRQGTGIGLYFSKMIIEGNMSGALTMENAEDGACFTISLPEAK